MIEVKYDTNPGMVRLNISQREPVLIWSYDETLALINNLCAALRCAWPGKDLLPR